MALTIWLTDRSRYETGTGHCQRNRYLTYHAGPHGYGWQRRAQSVPLITGGTLADILATLHIYIRDHAQQVPPEAQVQAWIDEARTRYLHVVDTRGLSNIVDAADLQRRTEEQLALLAGLTWVWYYIGLPAFLDAWKIVYVEEEGVTVLGCTCGLGDRMETAEAHEARGCEGIGWMTRGDLIGQAADGQARYSYHEFKAPGETNVNTDAAWNYRVQLIAGVLGDETRLDHVIDEVYLHQLLKGKRQAEWDPEQGKAVGPKFQNSPLVYGYRRPGNPPLLPETWAAKFNYVDEAGKRRRLGRDYQRTGIWELSDTGGLAPSQYWCRWIGADLLAEQYRMLGPLYREDASLHRFLRQLHGEERRWRDTLWTLHEAASTAGGWGTDAFMALLDEHVPQTRGQSCHNYYGEPCEDLPLCDQLDGWETPELLGYLPRRPHHAPELAQAIERGLLPPEEGVAEGVEE